MNVPTHFMAIKTHDWAPLLMIIFRIFIKIMIDLPPG